MAPSNYFEGVFTIIFQLKSLKAINKDGQDLIKF